ncbi:hypothetical protein [Gordonia polyisoprenivorans]|uniref:hypothetical protein n=1 Tax=Gordonia polyisoprenivorans TaxID=84595 RepID=UPI000B99DFF2|nr:hypothetical protein [Gordonia polyisoprenivorans]OZC32917.1 hypothetical protein CJJ17_16565 [Gordonia polyisoprenivorans]
MKPVSRIRTFGTFSRALATVGVAAALAVVAPAMLASDASAAPPPPMPAEFDLSRYTPVSPDAFRSLAYEDNGRSFFTTGRYMCQIGPQYRYVGCAGSPATAPADTPTSQTLGATIAGDQQGPFWVRTNWPFAPTYRFGSTTGFRPPILHVGQRVTIAGVTCTVPMPNEVACRTGSRALIFAPGWHKFFYPAWDQAHDGNPAPQYLPAALRGSSQLPATPVAPA